jgi:ribA/ribD-fused uncharacterized protein
MKQTKTHIYFWGSIYSQWIPSDFTYNNINFNTSEQFMMYCKALLFEDNENALNIIQSENPSEQKNFG